jgi:hypothetical protein
MAGVVLNDIGPAIEAPITTKRSTPAASSTSDRSRR